VILPGGDVVVAGPHAAGVAFLLRAGIDAVHHRDGLVVPDELRAYVAELEACQALRDGSGARRARSEP
jgi:hypothetical protein